MDLILNPPFLMEYFSSWIGKYYSWTISPVNHSSKEPCSNRVAIRVNGTGPPADPLHRFSTANVFLDDFIPGFHFVSHRKK
jgi:hypothetical protein